ncbi:MAG: MATE family efflux transporter [Myxococcales bacterium]
MVHSVTLFCLFPIFGLNGGTQPLVGYNFGARRPARVKSAAQWAIAGATALACLAFAVLQLFPHAVAGVFAGDDQALLDLCAQALSIASLLMPAIGFQIIAAGYFTSVGRPLTSMLLSLVPVAWLLPLSLGLHGIFFAVPVADAAAALVTAFFFVRELARLDAAARVGLGPDEPAPAAARTTPS